MSDIGQIGMKVFFRATVGASVPVNIKPSVPCLGVVLFNEGPSPVRIGNPSGTLAAQGMLLPSGIFFYDDLSDDAWWGLATTASGTISGFYIEA